jgi:hypothetical protein
MFDVFVFIQINQNSLYLSISAIDFYPPLVQFEQSKSIDWLNVCFSQRVQMNFIFPESVRILH